uniref:Uncharacterized protein n=1 Tax=Tanacetum cinerariifolium TaxID=118510 RepID=A0A6L2NPX3_TANCI|nr:hypothetical protein [Tanacetum cinerariifolium]
MQSVKSVDTKCETYGGPHSYTEWPAISGYTQEAAYATTGDHNLGGNSYQPQDGDKVIVEDAEMLFDVVDDLRGKEVFVSQEVSLKEVSVVDEINAVSTATTTTTTIDDITLAKALMEIKSVKPKTTTASTRPKAKGFVIHDQEQAPTSTVFSKQPSQVKDKGKGKMSEQELVKKLSKKDQLMLDEELAFKLQAKKEAKINDDYELAQRLQAEEQEELTGVEKKVEDDKESEELKKCLEIIPDDGDDVTINATPLSSKSPTIVDYNIYKEGKKNYFQIFRADDRVEKVKPVDNMDSFLLHNLKTMFEHHVEDNVWKNQQGLVKVKNWKLYDSCGVHFVTMQNILYYLLVEKMYPLTNHTLHQMFNDVKFQVDYECEMAFELLKLVKKQLKEGYVPQ